MDSSSYSMIIGAGAGAPAGRGLPVTAAVWPPGPIEPHVVGVRESRLMGVLAGHRWSPHPPAVRQNIGLLL